MIPIITIFAIQLSYVLLLGVQSRNVAWGRKLPAMFTSLLLGCGQLFILRAIPTAEDTGEIAAFLLAGPVGILLAISFTNRHKPPSE